MADHPGETETNSNNEVDVDMEVNISMEIEHDDNNEYGENLENEIDNENDYYNYDNFQYNHANNEEVSVDVTDVNNYNDQNQLQDTSNNYSTDNNKGNNNSGYGDVSSKIQEPDFNHEDDDRISKVSKTSKVSRMSKHSRISNASLLKDLEDKWEMIEKEKRGKSRKTSYSHVDKPAFGLNNNRNGVPSTNNTRASSKNEISHLVSKVQKKSNTLPFNNYKKKPVLKNIRNDNDSEINEFDSFVLVKSKELEKYKKGEVDMGSGGIVNLKNINNGFISNGSTDHNHKAQSYLSNDNNSIVYESNCKKWDDQPNYNSSSNKPSFLKSYSNSTKPKHNPLVFRGNNFSNFGTANNNDNNIDNLVYESGSASNFHHNNLDQYELDQHSSSRSVINPSKNLISKMQNIYGIITQQVSASSSPLATKNNNDSLEEKNEYIGFNYTGNTANLVNSIDRSYSLKNLDRNFENIFNKINPNYKKVDTSLKINYKINQEGGSAEYKSNKGDGFSNFSHNDPQLESKMNKLFNKNNNEDAKTPDFNKRSTGKNQDKILQKITENSSLLKNLFRTTAGNHGSCNKPYSLNNLNPSPMLKNSQSSYYANSPLKNEKIFGKNDFDELMNKMSAVSSVKVKKILNLNKTG